jgi:acetyl-CoA carboxylase carboxyl transferase subunit alpha
MYLDFEKPISDLETKIGEMHKMQEDTSMDMTVAIKNLEESLKSLQKDLYTNLNGWQRVQLSRHPDRPYALDYIQNVFDGFIELHGDRNVKDDKAMIGGFANIDKQSFMVIGHQKGRNTKQRQYRNFGMANPEGYRKALRLMRLAEKFGKPIVTLIDTPGAFPGLEAEERGQAEAIARNIRDMFMLKVPVICIIIGEGASGGALGIAIGDKVCMLENTWYTVISPESCSSILWRSWEHKERAAEALKLTANDMKGFALIDDIIKEPLGGAHRDPETMYKTLRKYISTTTKALQAKEPELRIEERITKFSAMGRFVEG